MENANTSASMDMRNRWRRVQTRRSYKHKKTVVYLDSNGKPINTLRAFDMKNKPKLSILRGMLFTYCVENSKNLEREETITSKDVNSAKELAELFDILTKPEFLAYREDEQKWFIETLQHFLEIGENFESVFYLFDTYFNDEIIDKREFMKILLECLERYELESAN